ncbi:hypothetical protein LTR56_015165 [Elasticomyces elasticus]|nr:hypothetical protein LTR56_015165 [Elasticomyces elasticus]KAK3644459.1 hypothetical protein LTR22_015179 [Elasticomyces elasticus]
MRLLDVHTLMLEEFLSEAQRPEYAILSHRWGEDEVSFKEWRKSLKTTGQGYEKIMRCCQFIKARPNWPQYVWIDTIAIDKRSSAELSEAINSMYQWYAQATVCIAYLSDVAGPWPNNQANFWERTLAVLPYSAWFTRGWTLQELLAPKRVLFCSAEWLFLGWKAQAPRGSRLDELIMGDGRPCITGSLNEITGIDSYVLQHPEYHQDRSIAQRMSWASRRRTTRPEDLAYSLLGLFSINMPLLYGEGASKAFMRLQMEIIRKSTDESIFAWEKRPYLSWNGVLSPSPAAFIDAGNVESLCYGDAHQDAEGLQMSGLLTDDRCLNGRSTYMMTHKGLEFRVPAWLIQDGRYRIYVVWLACARRSSEVVVSTRIMHIRPEAGQCYVTLLADSKDDVNDRVRKTRRYEPVGSLYNQFPTETWHDVGEKWFEVIQDGL